MVIKHGGLILHPKLFPSASPDDTMASYDVGIPSLVLCTDANLDPPSWTFQVLQTSENRSN